MVNEPQKSKALLRSKIFDAQDIGSEIVDVPEWGVKLKVKGMNGTERALFLRKQTANGDNIGNLFADVIIFTCYDPDTDEKVFDPVDRDVLNSKSGAVIQSLAIRAMQISGLSDVEEAKADLDDTQSDAST